MGAGNRGPGAYPPEKGEYPGHACGFDDETLRPSNGNQADESHGLHDQEWQASPGPGKGLKDETPKLAESTKRDPYSGGVTGFGV